MSRTAEAPGRARPRLLDSNDRPWVALLVGLYTVFHGLLLLDRGVYWDDWVFVRQPTSVFAEAYSQLGSPWPYWAMKWFFVLPWGPWAAHVVTFVSMLVATLCFYLVVRDAASLPPAHAFVTAALFAVYPTFLARVPAVMVAYSLPLAMFAVAALVMWRDVDRGVGWPARVAALALLMLSFKVASMLVFLYATYAIFVVVATRTHSQPAAAVLRRTWPYLAVPIAFWVLSKVFFAPWGLYADYNQLALPLLRSPGAWASALWAATGRPLKVALTAGGVLSIAAGAAAGALLRGEWSRNRRGDLAMIAVGAALVVVALFPYLAVGKIPLLEGFESRHQILVAFGMALGISGLLGLLVSGAGLPNRAVFAIAGAAIAAFGLVHVMNYVQYERDWHKQQVLMAQFAEVPAFKKGTTFLFVDRAPGQNVVGSGERASYEYAGLFEEVFGGQTRVGLDARAFQREGLAGIGWAGVDDAFRNRYFKIAQWDGAPPQFVVTIEPTGASRPGPPSWLAGGLYGLFANGDQTVRLKVETMTPDAVHP